MSQKIRTIRLRYLAAQLSEVAHQITKVHFSNLREADYTWRPEINVFQCASCFRICVELAGVDPGQIEIAIASGKLWVRGYRAAPEPLQQTEIAFASSRKPVRVIAMEIDHGLFERDVEVPAAFDSQKNDDKVGQWSPLDFYPTKSSRIVSCPRELPKRVS